MEAASHHLPDEGIAFAFDQQLGDAALQRLRFLILGFRSRHRALNPGALPYLRPLIPHAHSLSMSRPVKLSSTIFAKSSRPISDQYSAAVRRSSAPQT